jgi:mRNA-degrading endonuclease toxin of MazEF toxin-antitoxin module
MKKPAPARTIRRSVALPRRVVEDVTAVAPADLKGNLNRLVTCSRPRVGASDAKRVPRSYPTNVCVTAQETGLPRDTVFLCFQIRSLAPGRFRDPRTGQLNVVGRVPARRMEEVDQALRLTLDLA